MARFKGSFGLSLAGKTKRQQLAALPAYARGEELEFPKWKIRFILQNREFYQQHKQYLSGWLPKVQEFAPSFQKFEWNWQDGSRTLWDKIVQFRASGIRVKNPASAPSLVALTTSQVPVIPWEKRYMTMKECARLQSMDALKQLPESKTRAYKALGNAVNVDVIASVASNLISATSQPKKQTTITSLVCQPDRRIGLKGTGMKQRKIEYTALDQIALDPKNPRLGRSAHNKNLAQDEIFDLLRDWSLEELATSFWKVVFGRMRQFCASQKSSRRYSACCNRGQSAYRCIAATEKDI